MHNLVHAVPLVLRKYATFTGRASRPEFWWWTLAVVLATVTANLIDTVVLAPLLGVEDGQPLSVVFALAVILPNLAVAARRLHDTGRSGWWLLLLLLPILGALVLLYFYIQPSEPGPNPHGAPAPWPAAAGAALPLRHIARTPPRC